MKIDHLTPEEKRNWIALACGWKYYADPDIKEWGWMIAPSRTCRIPDEFLSDRLGNRSWIRINDPKMMPEYVSDLNAIHKAEKTIPASLRNLYLLKLAIICGDQELGNYDERWHLSTATAAQRSDAFLLTLPEPE